MSASDDTLALASAAEDLATYRRRREAELATHRAAVAACEERMWPTAGTCSICLTVVHRPSWASMLTCEACNAAACTACLVPSAEAVAGPVELVCHRCGHTRRQQSMTAELEALFGDLRDTRFDEALVVEISEIVGCSQAEARALLIRHQGDLEGAVRSYIASEGRRESFEHPTGP